MTTPERPRRRHAAPEENPYGQPAPGWPPRRPDEPLGYERPPYGQQPPPAGYERALGYEQPPPQPSFTPRQDAPPPLTQQMPPPGYQQQPGFYPRPFEPPAGPPQPPGRQRRKRHRARNVILSLAGVVVLIIIIAVASSGGGSGSPAASASSPAAATSAPAAPAAAAPSSAAPKAPAAPTVIASFTGSGIENTARFSAPSDYTVKWSYNCASFGQSGNFVVSGDGGSDFNGASVNELGNSGSGETHVYDDGGSHYLGIDSECSWSIQIVG